MVAQARRVIEIEVLADDALRKLGAIERSSRGAERSLSLLQRQVNALGTAFQGLVGFLGVSEFIALADAATDIEARLSSVSGSASQGRVAFDDLLQVSLRLGVGIEELSASYTKLGVAVPVAEHEQLTQALDVVSTVLATTGANVQQVNAVLLQFSQALGSSALQGDEFRAIAENAPVLLRAWRDAIGESNTAFRELSASAKLTTESFFENLDAIQANAVAMIGMSEPPLTVARAFQNLRSQALALIGESNGVTTAFALLAGSIQLVAENLDLVVSAAVAFGAVALSRVVSEAAIASGALAAGLSTAAASGSLLIGLAWGTLVTSLSAVARALASIAVFNLAGLASSLGALVATAARLATGLGVVLATLGRMLPAAVAVFAAFEAVTWVIDRVVEWWVATERLEQAMLEADKALLAVAARVSSVGNVDIDTSKLFELERAADAGERGIRDLNVQLESLERQRVEFSAGFIESAEDVNNLRRLNEQIVEVRTRIGLLTESSARYRAEIERVKASSDEFGSSLEEITAQADAFAAAQKRIEREDLRLTYELEIVTAELPDEVLRLELDQEFFRVVDQAQLAIDEALAKIQLLETQRELSRGLTEAEVEKIDSQISTLNSSITKNRATIEATTAAWEEHGDRLFETRKEIDALVAAKRLAEEQTRREEQALASYARALRGAAEAAGAAEGRLAAFSASGTAGAEAFDEQLRVTRSYEAALRLLNPALESVTEAQREAARAVADFAARQAAAERALTDAKRLAEVENALQSLGREADRAGTSLLAFFAFGEAGVGFFESSAESARIYERTLKQLNPALQNVTEEQRELARATADTAARQRRNEWLLDLARGARELREETEELTRQFGETEAELDILQTQGFEAADAYRKQAAFTQAVREENERLKETLAGLGPFAGLFAEVFAGYDAEENVQMREEMRLLEEVLGRQRNLYKELDRGLADLARRQSDLNALYERGAISAEKLRRETAVIEQAQAEAIRGRETLSIEQEIQDRRLSLQLAAREAEAFREGGERGARAFRDRAASALVLRDTLSDLSNGFRNVTSEAVELALEMQKLDVQESAAKAAEEQARAYEDLADALFKAQRAATQSEGAVEAFVGGGPEGLRQLRERNQLEEEYRRALRAQQTTLLQATEAEREYANASVEALRRQLQAQEELRRAEEARELTLDTADLQREVNNASQALEIYARQGQRAVDSLVAQQRVAEAVNAAYRRLNKVVGDELNPTQQEYIDNTRRLTRELENLRLAQASAEAVRSLGEALNEANISALQAENALKAFRRGGTRALEQFEKRAKLQEAFQEALELQNTTLAKAGPNQLAFAENITDALEKQLRAQEKLNRAKEAESRIEAFRARVTAIGAPVDEIEEVGIKDVQATLDRATSASFRGQRAEAEALLERARAQTEAFAETVDSVYDTKRLEDLRRDLIRGAETVLGAEAVQRVDFTRVDAALAGEEFALAITFDPQSVRDAIADLQARVSTEPLRVPVVIDMPNVPRAGPFGGPGVGIPPGANLAEALTGAADAVGGL